LLKSEALVVTGAYLMHHGVTLPWSFPERMWVLEGERL
jgi:alpha-galactosidase